jgi:gentisate 1,2-dioxygenase
VVGDSADVRELVALSSRILGHADQGDLVWGHSSARDPGGRGVWMKAAGWGLEEINPDRVQLVSRAGEVLDGTIEPGHAAVRYANPATGGDVLPTIRAEMHRLARGAQTRPVRETGSSVYAVFDGSGTVTVGGKTWSVTRGDLFVVPSWQPFSAKSEAGSTDSDSNALDLFRFSDSPVFEALGLNRALPED